MQKMKNRVTEMDACTAKTAKAKGFRV